jgi:peptidoglycan biosynthesis protein MviN/MurJ (putative lipid II flippase)
MTLLLWVPILKSRKFDLYKRFNEIKHSLFNKDTAKDILHYALPYALILISSQGILLFERYLASSIEPVGGISSMSLSYRITQFPIWVFAAAISRVILPNFQNHTQVATGKIFIILSEEQ